MRIQTFLAEPPVERFYIGIIGRLAGSGEDEFNTVSIGPLIQHPRYELRAIVHAHTLWSAPEHRHLVDHPNHVITPQSCGDFDRQALPRVDIDERERPQPTTVKELVSNKIHAPAIIDRLHEHRPGPLRSR